MSVSKGGAATGEAIVLAIDHGTSGCKTALITLSGEVVDFAFAPTPLHVLPGGGAEQDPEDWWRALVGTARTVLGRGLVRPEQVVAVACSSTFSTTVAVDASGAPLHPAITWLDSRGAPYIREVMGGFPAIKGYAISKLVRFIRLAGGGPTLSGKDDIAHVLYVQRALPDVYRRTATFLGSKDYLNLRLTGKVAASPDSVTLFWCTDNRDLGRVTYAPALLRDLGVDAAKLPPIQSSTDLLGPLRPEVASELGLPAGIPVVVGSADLQSACVGSGAVRDFEGHVYVGTSSWILCHVPFKKTDLRHTIASLPSALPGRYFCANEQDVAGGALGFLAKNLLFAPALHGGAAVPDDAYRRIDALAAHAPPGSRGVLFTPWLNGEKTPVDDEHVRGGFHNLSLGTDAADLCRAVLEGVALNSRWVLGHVERFVGRRLDPLHMIGGGAESPLWCQIYADVLDRTIRQVKDPLQANARGAAWLAALALRQISLEDIPRLVRIEREFRPDPAAARLYNGLFREFRGLYPRSRRLSDRIRGL